MILNENLFEDTKENLNEAYSARWDNMVTYSNPIKQQYADLVNDQIYDALDNIDVLASSKISDLPEQTDFGFDQAERVSKAISNLVRTMTKEYFLFTDLKDESLNEVKIADEIRAKQDTKEMTRRAIKMLKNLGGDYEDLAKEFKDAYGEDPLEEAVEKPCRYSDYVPQEKRKYWYFTTHGVQPGSIPRDLHVLEIRDGENEKGTKGTFVMLDGVLNTSELMKFDMKELVPKD